MNDQEYSHGDNLLGEHVDAIIRRFIDSYGVESTLFLRQATVEEIEENCKGGE